MSQGESQAEVQNKALRDRRKKPESLPHAQTHADDHDRTVRLGTDLLSRLRMSDGH